MSSSELQTTQKTTTDIETQATRRAALIDIYTQQKNTIEEQQTESDDSLNETQSNHSRVSISEKYNAIVRKWKRGKQQSHKTIVDFETDAELPTDEAELDVSQLEKASINKIRFVFEDGSNTLWYMWNPTDETLVLNHIIEHYADGEISQLFGCEVFCKEYQIDAKSGFTIEIPTPYDKNHAHLKHTIMKKLHTVGDGFNAAFGSDYTFTTRNSRHEHGSLTKYRRVRKFGNALNPLLTSASFFTTLVPMNVLLLQAFLINQYLIPIPILIASAVTFIFSVVMIPFLYSMQSKKERDSEKIGQAMVLGFSGIVFYIVPMFLIFLGLLNVYNHILEYNQR